MMRSGMVNGVVSVLLLAGVLPSTASAADVLCDHKSREVREQLSHARVHGNSHQIEGLQRALNAIESNCTNERVILDAEKEVSEARQEVDEHQAELDKAMDDGDKEDIQDARDDLEEARQELREATQELDDLKAQAGR